MERQFGSVNPVSISRRIIGYSDKFFVVFFIHFEIGHDRVLYPELLTIQYRIPILFDNVY